MPLGTKCSVPAAPRSFIGRSRLEAMLADDVRRSVTLVSAPPGAGKTTLLAGWYTGRAPESSTWLTLDSRDNDPGRLTRVVLTAIARTGMLPSRFARATRPDTTLLDAAFQELASTNARQVLVLDDTHELTAPDALGTLAHLVERAPGNLDIVMATRADPPLGLGRLRLADRLTEIRGADLAFTLSETSTMLAAAGVVLCDDDVAALWNWTEGWVAGLRLAAHSLERGADPRRFVADLGPDEAGVSDYLIHEVLLRQDAKVQDFLLRTSVVDRLTPDLATLLSDDPAAGERLAELEHGGVFLARLSGESGWFRYHALLATLLRARLRLHDPSLATELQRRAAEWHSDHGMTPEAAELARTAGDWTLLGELLGRQWLEAILAGDDVAVRQLEGVPPDVVATTPMLALLATADACASDDAVMAARYRRALADRGLLARRSAAGMVPLDVATAVVDVLHGCAFGANPRAHAAARWLHRTRTVDHRADYFMAVRAAELRLDAGDTRGAERELEALAEVAEPHGPILEGQALLALLHAVEGRIGAAETLAAEVLDHADERSRAYYLSQLAGLLCGAQRGDSPGGSSRALVLRLPHGSRPLRAVHRAVTTWLASGSPVVGLDTATARHPFAGRVLVAVGVLEVLDAGGSLVALGGPAEGAVRRAREALASRGHSAAITALAPWLRPESPPAVLRTQIEALVLGAIARRAQGDSDAPELLRTAIGLASDGLIAPLLVHGPALVEQLEHLAAEGGPQQALALELTDAVRHTKSPAVAAPLTEREQIVLRYLPTMMSNAEIAESMYVSVNTVKTHLKALYRKLGVDRRRDAVVRARQLELL
jgi:LuxR family maltose regulon positive regulatory protein